MDQLQRTRGEMHCWTVALDILGTAHESDGRKCSQSDGWSNHHPFDPGMSLIARGTLREVNSEQKR